MGSEINSSETKQGAESKISRRSMLAAGAAAADMDLLEDFVSFG